MKIVRNIKIKKKKLKSRKKQHFRIVNNYYINRNINFNSLFINKGASDSYLRLPVILDKLVINVSDQVQKGFYSQLVECDTYKSELIRYLSEQEIYCLDKFDFLNKDDSLKLDDGLKDSTKRIFYPTSVANFVYNPVLSLQINHTGEHFQSIDTSNYMTSIARSLSQVRLDLENIQIKRLDLAVDFVVNSDNTDFIQHFIYAYLIKRIHIPWLKKDKINFINFDSTINNISSLDVNDLKKVNGLIDPLIIENENKDIINNTNLITGFYIGNIKSRYHNSSICVYYKHIQEGSLKKKIRFELRFKNKKATGIFFEIISRLQNSGDSYEKVANSIFYREFRSLVSVKKYPKVHKKSDNKDIREYKQLYRVKNEAPWFTQLCNSFLSE